jgi:hypothetical protein
MTNSTKNALQQKCHAFRHIRVDLLLHEGPRDACGCHIVSSLLGVSDAGQHDRLDRHSWRAYLFLGEV